MTTNTPALFDFVTHDVSHERESWRFFAIIRYAGTLEMDPEQPRYLSERQTHAIYRFLATRNIWIKPAGNGSPGSPFAGEPNIDIYQTHLILTQSGGMDI